MGETTLAKVESKQARGAQAFTLMEILVTISIILLLVGILIPVLGSARETARRAKCQSNLHQLSLANSAYATDNKGWFCTSKPTMATQNNIVSDRSVFQAGYIVRSTNASVGEWCHYGNLYVSYLNQSATHYYCPSADGEALGSSGCPDGGLKTFSDPDTSKMLYGSYFQRGPMEGAPLSQKGMVVYQNFDHPFSSANWSYTYEYPNRALMSDLASLRDETSRPNHSGLVNVLFSDHAVKNFQLPRSDWRSDTGDNFDGKDEGTLPGSWKQFDRGRLE